MRRRDVALPISRAAARLQSGIRECDEPYVWGRLRSRAPAKASCCTTTIRSPWYECPPHAYLHDARLEWVLADQQVLLALTASVLADYRYEPSKPSAAAAFVKSMAIAAARGRGGVRGLADFAATFITPPSLKDAAGTVYRLGPDEYFLLGDNSPHSLDSRHWAPAERFRATSDRGPGTDMVIVRSSAGPERFSSS